MSEAIKFKKTTKRSIRKKPTSDGEDVEESNDAQATDDHRQILQDALELREFRKRTQGMTAADLMKGDPKTQKVVKPVEQPVADPFSGGFVDPTLIKADKLSGQFTTQSNAMDTDALMRDYIERELKKRRGDTSEQTVDEPSADHAQVDHEDDLFHIPDYLQLPKAKVKEGNVTLSTSMLTAIPEIDLGIQAKLKNIEDTEVAKKRAVAEREKNKNKDPIAYIGSTLAAADRFWNGKTGPDTDGSIFGRDGAPPQLAGIGTSKEEGKKRKTEKGGSKATDDQTMERFKKRSRR
ncbi:hypothetical protein SmJEL517_g05083 [Synchytrium microbalum]|uniref:Uncharacterized protein n=1 Tax=Synchytrium microbalum TaxID=1806994 RepID=A0A507BWZ2_9FUNG|nr:uncharacterized protein SmJEL517_g05083 [Synchytrium microbalum]TPX31668.1 hypothetical protein SmJEL517_g05083 [Synchytrium microbalum]